MHLSWALRAMADADGYIASAGQEVCLQVDGGLQLASAPDRRSDEFRRDGHAEGAAAAPQPDRHSDEFRRNGHAEGAAAPPAGADGGHVAVRADGEHVAEANAHARCSGAGSGCSSSPSSSSSSSSSSDEPPDADMSPRHAGQPCADSEASSEAEAPPAAVGVAARVGRSSWTFLDEVDLATEFATPVPTLQSAPRFVAAGVRAAFSFALRAVATPAPAAGATRERAWKLFLLVPRLLLCRPPASGSVGKAALLRRVTDFQAGRWSQLLHAARAVAPARAPAGQLSEGARSERARARACAQVQRGELSRARQTLTSAPLAPGNAETLRALSDPARRPPQPRDPIPAEVASFVPESTPQLAPAAVAEALRSAKRGSAAGLSGATMEHYKLLLEDDEAVGLLAQAASLLVAADVPPGVLAALALSRLTALSKPGGGVRGIATGDTFRRLVSRVLARQFADDFDRATRPYQFALQARAGTDCLAAMLRAAVELDGRAVIVSLDGRSAYDTVSRAAFLTKVQEVVPTLLPFVRAFYGRTSEYLWWDAEGRRHTIQQGDGCEQGDALAPALFALAQHLALDTAQAGLREGEFLAAFLDDLYIVTWPERARQAYDLVTHTVELHAGVAANQGKTRVHGAARVPAPPGIEELGDDV